MQCVSSFFFVIFRGDETEISHFLDALVPPGGERAPTSVSFH
jgi:hypothetical protein